MTIGKIKQLSNEKYRTWEWNYGRNPKYNFEREHKFERGFIQIKLDVKKEKSNMLKYLVISLEKVILQN